MSFGLISCRSCRPRTNSISERGTIARRLWRRSLFTALLATGTWAAPSVRGADIWVSSMADAGAGSLRDAIELANLNPTGADTIRFDNSLLGQTITVQSMLPMISKGSGGSLNIVGLGSDQLVISGQNQSRVFWVESGNVTIENVKIADGLANGGSGAMTGRGGGGGGGLGAGGAVFVNSTGSVTMRNVRLANNSAQGGHGGEFGGVMERGGGGGGGLGGNGGAAGYFGGGGGGGLLGAGGSGDDGGGGGGGTTQAGGNSIGSSGGTGGGSEGGNGGTAFSAGTPGQTFGGGGGGGEFADGGAGGDFGGGGGGGEFQKGGNGGFGGGGGGAAYHGMMAGQGGFGAGDGGQEYTGGDGGDGLGGAVFVRQGGTITFENVVFTDGAVAAGSGGMGYFFSGTDGTAASSNVYAMEGASVNFAMSSNSNLQLDGQDFTFDQLSLDGDGTIETTGDITIQHGVTVNSGTFRVNSNTTTDVTVNSNGTLGGSGTIIGALILNGTLAPGNSIGTLNVNGNATFSAGSTTTIEINDAGTVSGVNNDSIVVNGNVIIQGGTVNVVSAPGNYINGSIYTFLTGNSVTGTFDSIVDDLAFFDASLIYGLNSVSFELIANMSDFSMVAATENQLSVAQFIDANSSSPPSDLQSIIDAMTPMTNQQVQQSLDQMSGSIYPTLPTAGLQHTTYYISQLSTHIKNLMAPSDSTSGSLTMKGPVDELRTDGWISGYGLGGQADSDGNADGFRYGIGGTQVGVQTMWQPGHAWGLWSNMAWSNLRGRQLNESANIENYHFGTYLSGRDEAHYYLVLGGIGYDHAEVQRHVQIGNVSGSPRSTLDGWQANSYIERGLSVDVGTWAFQPYTGLQYAYLRQAGAKESGGGAFNLATTGIDANSLRSSLGGRFSKSMTTGSGLLLTPEFRSAWFHEFLDTNYLIGAQFSGLPGAGFTVRGVDLGRDWASTGAGFSLGAGRGARLFAGYDAQYNSQQVLHVGSGGLELLY